MKNYLTYLLLVFLLITSCSQSNFEKVSYSEVDPAELYIQDGESTELFYMKLIPSGKIKGAIVVLPSGAEPVEDLLKQISLPHMALSKGIATIVPSINWGTEDRKTEINMIDDILKKVCSDYNIPKDKIVLGGLSNGGMVSLTYAEQAVKNEGSTYMVPLGVFGLDVPLDKAHLYEYAEREIKRDFSEAGVNEAHWIINNYKEQYGGSPNEVPQNYLNASIYSNGAPQGGNAKYLKNIPIRMYTDLDVNWLMNERRRDLYDWNGTDIVAMINDLKLMGNQDANVIITMGKGVRLDGTPHPHSWSIMDNEDCLAWIERLIYQ